MWRRFINLKSTSSQLIFTTIKNWDNSGCLTSDRDSRIEALRLSYEWSRFTVAVGPKCRCLKSPLHFISTMSHEPSSRAAKENFDVFLFKMVFNRRWRFFFVQFCLAFEVYCDTLSLKVDRNIRLVVIESIVTRCRKVRSLKRMESSKHIYELARKKSGSYIQVRWRRNLNFGKLLFGIELW